MIKYILSFVLFALPAYADLCSVSPVVEVTDNIEEGLSVCSNLGGCVLNLNGTYNETEILVSDYPLGFPNGLVIQGGNFESSIPAVSRNIHGVDVLAVLYIDPAGLNLNCFNIKDTEFNGHKINQPYLSNYNTHHGLWVRSPARVSLPSGWEIRNIESHGFMSDGINVREGSEGFVIDILSYEHGCWDSSLGPGYGCGVGWNERSDLFAPLHVGLKSESRCIDVTGNDVIMKGNIGYQCWLGVQVNTGLRVSVTENHFEQTGTGLVCHLGCTGVFSHNTIKDSVPGASPNAGSGFSSDAYTADLIVEDNDFINLSGPGATYTGGGQVISQRNNIVACQGLNNYYGQVFTGSFVNNSRIIDNNVSGCLRDLFVYPNFTGGIFD